MSAPAIVRTQREQWLARRRELVTASDVGRILLGQASDVYLEKLGLREVEETEPMRWGRRLEEAIAEGYHDETGRMFRRWPMHEVAEHPDLPWLGATLDFVQLDAFPTPAPPGASGDGVLETKASSFADRWDDEPPLQFQLQLTVQMACTRRQWGTLAAFLSLYRPVVYRDFALDEELFGLMVPQLEEFHWRVRRQYPPVDRPDWFTNEAVKKLWPRDDGTSVALDDEALAEVQDWQAAKADEKACEQRADDLEKRLRLRMGAATCGFLKDGTSLSLKTTAAVPVAAHTRAAYRTLRRFTPKHLKRRK